VKFSRIAREIHAFLAKSRRQKVKGAPRTRDPARDGFRLAKTASATGTKNKSAADFGLAKRDVFIRHRPAPPYHPLPEMPCARGNWSEILVWQNSPLACNRQARIKGKSS
jgi:hypothetical protein